MNGPAHARGALPAGYRESFVRGTHLVSQEEVHDTLLGVIGSGVSLHAWAAARDDARPLQGRGVSWATGLDGTGPVVVRHSRHGGLLAPLTGDLFLAPSRAPRELAIACRLRDTGVPTPRVVAFATYSVAGPLCRADVMTALVPGHDLPDTWLNADAAGRRAIVGAVGRLLASLARAGAAHADLNARNILVAGAGDAPAAWVLDVDRVVFLRPSGGEASRRNAARLERSIVRLRRESGLDFTDADWAAVRAAEAGFAGDGPGGGPGDGLGGDAGGPP